MKVFTNHFTTSKFCFFIFLLLSQLSNKRLSAQCTYGGVQYLSFDASTFTTSTWYGSACYYGGEYMEVTNVLPGDNFSVSSCVNGVNAYDNQITVFINGNATAVAFNDDNGPLCSGISASVTFTAPSPGIYRILNNEYNCATNATCGQLFIRKNPFTPIDNVAPETNPVFTSASGCSAGSVRLGAGAYYDMAITPNTWYNFSWVNGGANNNGFRAYVNNGTGHTSSTFSSTQNNWFSGSTTSLHITAIRVSNVWSSTSAVLNYSNATPTPANAGPDQTGAGTCGLTAVTLAGNTPTIGFGSWSIIAGSGGVVNTPSSATSTFSGVAGNAYTLRRTINNNGCTSTDDVNITFNRNPTPANAGPDQTSAATCGLTSVTLAANAPSIGSGAWSVVSGTGGSFGNTTFPTTSFSGTAGNTYTLRWTTSSTPCPASTDDVIVTFNRNPTTANAGADQTGLTTCGLTSLSLAGNTPSVGGGTWSIITGTGGTISSPNSATSTFSGTVGTPYTLRWTIANSPCTSSADDVNITFNPIPNTAFSGLNSTYCVNSSSSTLTPTVAGGTFSGPGISGNTFDPVLAGPGTHNIAYNFPSYSVAPITFAPSITSGTTVPLPDDGLSAPQNIGFNFNFFGAGYTQFEISSNGFITFNTGSVNSGCCVGQSIPNASVPNNLIAACWNDLNPPANGSITYSTQGTIPNRRLIVSYNGTPFSGNTSADVNTQIILYETTNVIEIHTSSITGATSGTTMGVENNGGTQAIVVPGRNSTIWSATNEAWRFTPQTPCPNGTTQSVTVRSIPTLANAGGDRIDASTCGLTSLSLAANSPTSGTGQWSIQSGTGGSFNNTSSPTATFTGVASETYALRWTISNSPCTPSFDDVVITFNPNPTTANAGADQTGAATCGLTEVTLSANTPSAGNGAWSMLSGNGGNLSNPLNAASAFNGVSGETYVLRWTTTNAPCAASIDDVTVTFNQNPTESNAGADQTGANTCDLTSVTLNGNAPAVGNGAWSIIAGTGGTVTTPSQPNSTFTGTAGSSYTLRWTVSNAPCTSSTDDVDIIFNQSPSSANAGADQTGASTCGLTSISLEGNTPTNGAGAWSILAGTGGVISNASNPSSAFDGILGNTYTLRWTITNAPCNATFDDVVVQFNRNPTSANAGADRTDATTCGLTSISMAANSPSIGTGAWSVTSGTGGVFGTPGSPNSSFNGVAGNSYTLLWTISNAPCPSSSDEVLVTLNRNPTIANAGADRVGSSTCGLTSLNLAGNTPSIGSGLWSIIAGTGGSISVPTSPTSNFSGVAGNSYTLRWTTSNPPCNSSSDDVLVTFTLGPSADFTGLDTAYCITSSPTSLTPTNVGGTFTGNGISGSSFSPSIAGVGTHNITYNLPAYALNSITYAPYSTTGFPVFLADEDVSATSNIGFSFTFFGNTYSQFRISSNGFITFNTSSSDPGCCQGQVIPNTITPNNLVAACWNDLDPSSGGSISYFTQGTIPNRRLVVSYTGIPFYGFSSPDVTTQIVLYETSNIIEIHTTSIINSPGNVTMGIENVNGTQASAVPGRNSGFWVAANEAWRFTPSCPNSVTKSVAVKATPTTANAGGDSFVSCGINSVMLGANNPLAGNGTWSILSGIGGSFDDSTSSLSFFNGTSGTTYNLRWEISNDPCVASTDEVEITFQNDQLWYRDNDNDLYSDGDTIRQCIQPIGYYLANTLLSLSGDCDDTNDAIYPGAVEICNGIDDDCDGIVDNGVSFTTYYADADADGFGNASVTTSTCDGPPAGYVSNNTDCDDTNDAIYPGAVEICNGIDDDCDGQIDNNVLFVTYYLDNDGDGYGDITRDTSTCSGQPSGYVLDKFDCDDRNPSIHPNATEVCNGIDDNCDGLIDNGAVFNVYYIDSDADGFGSSSDSILTCETTIPTGYVSNNTDCDDTNDAIYPGAVEICNGIDDDCDGIVDNGVSFTTYYADADGDGFGDASVTTSTCDGPPAGYVSNNTDCDDTNDAIYPGAPEACGNGTDDNCDGIIDSLSTFITYYWDADGDGYGDIAPFVSTCDGPPAGYVNNNTDCDDTNDAIYPGAVEICNGIDDDCDGVVDNDVTFTTYYADADGDGFGDASVTTSTCDGPPAGYVGNNTDCNDSNSTIHPNATEVCNGIDDNCNGLVDDGLLFTTYYADTDSDGFGNPAIFISLCDNPPLGYVTLGTDCNDNNPAIHPNATEVCNGIDDNCNGIVDDGVSNNPPPVQSIFGPTTVCAFQTNLVYTAPYLAGMTYFWGVPNHSTIISGQGTNSIVVNWGNRQGNVDVYMFSSCGRGQKTMVRVQIGNCAAKNGDESTASFLTEKEDIFLVKAYPNPFYEHLQLKIESESDQMIQIRIYDVLGQLVSNQNNFSNETDITIGETLLKGIYFLEVIQGEKMQVLRIVKSD